MHIPQEEADDGRYVLNPQESYLFQNCTRHSSTLGLMLGVPLALGARILALRRFPRANKHLAGISAAVPALIGTYVAVESLYTTRICWGYLRLLPEESQFKQLALRSLAAQEEDSWGTTINRWRALMDVMVYEAKVQSDTDLTLIEDASREEKHEFQKRLRWTPPEQFRLLNRIHEHYNAENKPLKEKMDKIAKGMFGKPEILTNEHVLHASKPLKRVEK